MLLFQLSENVIDRMKETSPSGPKSPRYSGAYGASGTTASQFQDVLVDKLEVVKIRLIVKISGISVFCYLNVWLFLGSTRNQD